MTSETRTASRSGYAIVSVGILVTALVQWMVVWIFARLFGASTVGVYSTLYAVATPLFVLAQLGLKDVYLSMHVQYPDRSYKAIRIVGSLLGALALLVIGECMSLPTSFTAAMALMKIGESVIDMRFAFSQARLHMHRVGALMIIYAVLMAVTVFTVVGLGGRPEVAVALTGVLGVLISLIDSRIPLAEIESEVSRGYRRILHASIGVTSSQLVFALIASAPLLLLFAAGDDSEVGIFGGANYLITAGSYVGATLQLLLLPTYRHLARKGDYPELARSVRKLLTTIVGLSIPASIIAIVFGDTVLALVYGEDFRVGLLVLVLIVFAAALTIPGYVLGSVLLVLNAYYDGIVAAVIAILAGVAGGVLALWLGTDPLEAASICALVAAFIRIPIAAVLVAIRWKPAKERAAQTQTV